MLTDLQKSLILSSALLTFKVQNGISLNEADFDIIIDKPSTTSLCSLHLVSKRTDDHLRIKLYVKDFGSFTSLSNLVLMQEEGYTAGPNDEVHVGSITLDRVAFRSFYQYLISPQYQSDIVLATDRIMLEDGTGFLLSETNGYIVQEF